MIIGVNMCGRMCIQPVTVRNLGEYFVVYKNMGDLYF